MLVSHQESDTISFAQITDICILVCCIWLLEWRRWFNGRVDGNAYPTSVFAWQMCVLLMKSLKSWSHVYSFIFQHRSTLYCYSASVAIRGLMFCNRGQAVNQTKNVWRPLHKPKWWDIFKRTRQNASTAMDHFKGGLNMY